MMKKRSSGHKPLGLSSPTSPGATSVWVGARPAHQPARPAPYHSFANGVPEDSNPRRLSSTGSDGQYFVVSVRNSTSDSEPSGGAKSAVVPPTRSTSTSSCRSSSIVSPAIPLTSSTSISALSPSGAGPKSAELPPTSSTSFTHSSNIVGRISSSSSSGGPFSPTSPPFGGLQLPPNTYLHNVALAGNTGNILGNAGGNVLGSTGALYSGGSFLPVAASSMAVLPQGGYDPNAFLFQQPLGSPDLLAASLGQTLSLSQGHALYTLPQPLPPLISPQPSPPYLGHSFDLLSAAAMSANQTLQSPTSPVFSPLVTASGLSPPLNGTALVGQSFFGVSSPPLPILSDAPSNVPVSKRESFTGGGHKRFLSSSGSLEQGDDQTTSGVGSSVPSSPSDSFPTSPSTDRHLLTSGDESHVQGVGVVVDPCYDRPLDREACMRCGKKVYAMEKVGPVKDVLYHKTCFTCCVCHTRLSLNSFHHNDADLADLNVYCGSHKPLAKANPLDSNAVGIQRALSVPKPNRVNDQIRGGPEASKNIHLDSHSVSIRAAMHVPATDLQTSIMQREGAWFREQRKSQAMPPRNVVRHGSQEGEYEGSRSLYTNPS